MAFKTVQEFNKERGYDNYFTLRNDGDSADVIILYRSTSDVLIADAHYIKSNDYTGYVHCCGRGCPACGKNISVRNKLFVPLYNLNSNKIEFWDRSTFFENQLNQDVFNRYPNPSEFVFRITRHGQARDVNTTYEIRAVGRNDQLPYDVILANFGKTSILDFYDNIIKEYSTSELENMLNSNTSTTVASSDNYSYNEMPSYQVTPRTSYNQNTPAQTAIPVDDIDLDDNLEVPFDSDVPSLDDDDVDF